MRLVVQANNTDLMNSEEMRPGEVLYAINVNPADPDDDDTDIIIVDCLSNPEVGPGLLVVKKTRRRTRVSNYPIWELVTK